MYTGYRLLCGGAWAARPVSVGYAGELEGELLPRKEVQPRPWVVADPAGGPWGGSTQCLGCGAVCSQSYAFVEVAAIGPRD